MLSAGVRLLCDAEVEGPL